MATVTEIQIPRTSEEREVQGFYIQVAVKLRELEERLVALEAKV